MGVSSLSMKDKTMLYRNGADIKPFGTSCPTDFPLKSGMCHRTSLTSTLFQTEKILQKNSLFSLVSGSKDAKYHLDSVSERDMMVERIVSCNSVHISDNASTWAKPPITQDATIALQPS